MSDFLVGLQITGLGMGLVFLTLIIVMLAIVLLNWFFRDGSTMQTVGGPQPPRAIGEAVHLEKANQSDEAVAIGLAITLKRQDEIAAIALAIALEQERLGASDDREREAETVNVLTIDPGPGVWSGYGRFKATL